MEAQRFARLQLDLPHANELVLKQDIVADIAQLDPALGGKFQAVFVIHGSARV
jgi:hypothetical protein